MAILEPVPELVKSTPPIANEKPQGTPAAFQYLRVLGVIN